MSRKLTDKKLDRMAMLLWAKLRGITKNIEIRWDFIKDDSVTDQYRDFARALAKELGYE